MKPYLNYGGCPPPTTYGNIKHGHSKGDAEGDAFFTKPEVAKRCFDHLQTFITPAMNDHFWIEPSAGSGVFLDLMPEGSLGLDLNPRDDRVQQQDFLAWQNKTGRRLIAIGNPPFGKSGGLAFAFMQRLFPLNCDLIGFILPMIFAGSTMQKRLGKCGWGLAHSEALAGDSFALPDGKDRIVNCVWQVWDRQGYRGEDTRTCDDFIEVTQIDLQKPEDVIKACGCDLFVRRSFTHLGQRRVFQKAEECGSPHITGLFFKQNRQELFSMFYNVNPDDISVQTSVGFWSIPMESIRKFAMDAGFVDSVREEQHSLL